MKLKYCLLFVLMTIIIFVLSLLRFDRKLKENILNYNSDSEVLYLEFQLQPDSNIDYKEFFTKLCKVSLAHNINIYKTVEEGKQTALFACSNNSAWYSQILLTKGHIQNLESYFGYANTSKDAETRIFDPIVSEEIEILPLSAWDHPLRQRNPLGMFFMDASENIDINEAFQKVQAEMKQVFPQISMSATQLVNHAHKTKTMSFTEMVILALSGFIIVRVAIAKLLLKDCDLILGDEPTASLDEENRDLILGLFRKMADNGKTVLLVSHDVNVQSFADYRMMI